MTEFLTFAKDILGPDPGVTLFLLAAVGALVKAYIWERRKNDKCGRDRVKESREDTRLVAGVLANATAAISSYKDQNVALTTALTAVLHSAGHRGHHHHREDDDA